MGKQVKRVIIPPPTNLTDWPTLMGGGEGAASRALRDLGCLGTMTARAAAPLLLSFFAFD